MATLELIVTSNASSVLPSIDRRLDSTADKAEKLKKQFSSIDFKFPTGGFTNPLLKMPDVSSFTSTLKNITSDTIKFTIAVGAYFLEINDKFEQMEILLRMTTGSAKEGQQVFDNLIDLSAKVPYSIDSLTDMFVKLKSAGIGPAYDYTVRLTDALSAFDASSDKLKLVSIAIMQMASKGTLSMEELKRQFGEQVPTALRLLQDELRKTGKLAENESLAVAIGAGKIGAKTGIEALISSLERYKGVGEERMNSFKGSLVLVDNQIQLLMRDIGKSEGSFSSISHAIQAAADMIKKFRTSAEGMEVIEKIARGVADGFNKITEHPEVIYQYFITIGELVGTATSALKFMVVALNNVLSTYDLISGKISATAFTVLPKDFSMEGYSKIRSQLIEYTDLKTKAENSSVTQSAKGFFNSPAAFTFDKLRQSLTFNSKDTLPAFGDIDKTKEQLDKLFSVISSGGTELSNYVQVQGKSASASDDQKVAMQGVVDILGKNTTAQTEHNKTISYYQNEREKAYSDYQEALKGAEGKEEETRVLQKYHEVIKRINDEESRKSASGALKAEKAELTQLSASLKNYANDARDATEAAREWNSLAEQSISGMKTLNDQYATANMNGFDKVVYEQNKAFTEGTVELGLYQKSLSEVDNKVAELTLHYQVASAGIEEYKSKLSANSAGSNEQDLNKLHTLESAQNDLSKELIRQTDIQTQLTLQQKSGIQTEEQLRQAIISGKDALEERRLALIDTLKESNDFFDNFQAGTLEFAHDSEHIGSSIANAISSGFQSATDALADFVTTGKLNFSDFADSIISDLARIAIQKSITGVLASSIGSLFGSVVSGASGGGGIVSDNFTVDAIYGRASGGLVSSGSMYEVNETGMPELLNLGSRQYLMMGNQSGSVAPLDGTQQGVSSASGGTGLVVNIYAPSSTTVKQEQRQENGVNIVDVMFEQMENKMWTNVARGGGIGAQTLQQTFGLNRAVGAY